MVYGNDNVKRAALSGHKDRRLLKCRADIYGNIKLTSEPKLLRKVNVRKR
jgi:hypothetical protein